jgi:hypothetical protein
MTIRKQYYLPVVLAAINILIFSIFVSCKNINTIVNKSNIITYKSKITVNYTGLNNGMLITGVVKNMTGNPIPAYIRIFNKERTLNHIDVFAQAYADINGEFSIEMPEWKTPGEYEIVVYRGPEYEYFSGIIDIKENRITNLNINLSRITDMPAIGWYGGEVHQHSKRVSPGYGSDGNNTMEEMAEANAAVGLHFGVLTDHNQNVITGNDRFTAEGNRYYLDSGNLKFLPIPGCEVTTRAGHFNAWNSVTESGEHYYVDYFVDTGSTQSKINGISKIADDINTHSILSVINHPSSLTLGFIANDFDWLQNKDLTLKFDAVEIWNGLFICTWVRSYGSIPYFSVENNPSHIAHKNNKMSSGFIQWYKLLNSGVKFPAVGGSDTHNRIRALEGHYLDMLIEQIRNANKGTLPIFNSMEETIEVLSPSVGIDSAINYALKDNLENAFENMEGIPGMPRTYAYIGNKTFTKENIAQAIKNGNSFITSGPLIKAEINGKMPGETANVAIMQKLSLDILCNRTFNRIQIIADGELVKTLDTRNITRYKNNISIPELKGKKWAIVYVEGGENYQFAFTNPIYFF